MTKDMTYLQILLPSDLKRKVKRRAEREGKSVSEYVRDILEREVSG